MHFLSKIVAHYHQYGNYEVSRYNNLRFATLYTLEQLPLITLLILLCATKQSSSLKMGPTQCRIKNNGVRIKFSRPSTLIYRGISEITEGLTLYMYALRV